MRSRFVALVCALALLAACGRDQPQTVRTVAQPDLGPVWVYAVAFREFQHDQWRWAVAVHEQAVWMAAATRPPAKPHEPRSAANHSHATSRSETGTGHCGGSLPPCWVLDRESGYNDGDPSTYDIHAYNPTGCSGRGCRGKWQCDPRTCSGQGSEEEQDAEAAALWDGGSGCAHWGAC